MSTIAVIGSGFSGISAASYLAAMGHKVHIFEKNESLGGRARQLKTENGYLFDMGPSWYWMPEIFEKFFNDFGTTASEFYELKRLQPSFDMVFAENDMVSIPSDFDSLCKLFDSIEEGSAAKLVQFMQEAEYKYNTGMKNLAYKPGLSLSEFIDMDLFKGVFKLQLFTAFSKHVRKYFSNPKLISLMEFPVLFLGGMPKDIPALYSLMNYAGLKLGTWYPMGGFGLVIDAMLSIAKRNGAVIHKNANVEQIKLEGKLASGLIVNGIEFPCDGVVASADYHHIESKLLPQQFRNYNESYWDNKVLAPSCLIFYIGVSKTIQSIKHHTLFFEEDLNNHSYEIYTKPQWPTKPLFYVCCPSKTDDSVAPIGHENLFLLMPIAVGLEDTEAMREKYFNVMISRLEDKIGEKISSYIDYKKSYCLNDFVFDYNAFKGNAYGLANTLRQTAILKPKIKNNKIKNLFYAGQLTVPGPGVPPSLISGKLAATLLHKYLN